MNTDTINAIIVDDELASRTTLNNYVKKYCPEIKVVDSVDNIEKAKKSIAFHQPALVFLDIEMPYGNAFDLLESLEKVDFEIIFVTAYEHYAIRALNMSAAYYLLKPIDIEKLIKSVRKIVIQNKKSSQMLHSQILLDNIKSSQVQNKKIVLPQVNGFDVVLVTDIVRAEANDNYTNIYLVTGKKYLISKTLKHFDDLLSGYDFFRSHKSHLVNVLHISQYIKGNIGRLKMTDGSFVDVAASRKKELFDRLK